MNQLNFSISIAHLYPDLLNIYGDLGNVITLRNRALWRGIEVQVSEIKAGGKINPNNYDIYFIGGGQDKQQILASVELLKNKDAILSASETDAVFLAICGGYQLFGEYYQPFDADRLMGVGVLDVYTVASNKRLIGNVAGTIQDNPDIKPLQDFPCLSGQTIVGFENHSGLTYLKNDAKPFLKLIKGGGNNGSDKMEGARKKNVFGTYLHGPILPKNPHFADYLLSLALKRKYKCEIPLEKLDDSFEENAHEYCINHTK